MFLAAATTLAPAFPLFLPENASSHFQIHVGLHLFIREVTHRLLLYLRAPEGNEWEFCARSLQDPRSLLLGSPHANKGAEQEPNASALFPLTAL